MRTVSEVIACYESGIYTKAETVSLFICWSSERAPETFVPEISSEILATIRHEVRVAPRSQSGIVSMGCGPVFEKEFFEGARILHQYFYDGFVIDCSGVTKESEFWQRYLETTQPDGAEHFGRNLDAFLDALNGGPGYPSVNVLTFTNSMDIQHIENGIFYQRLGEIAHKSTQITLRFE